MYELFENHEINHLNEIESNLSILNDFTIASYQVNSMIQMLSPLVPILYITVKIN